MKAIEGRLGRVFILRLDDGEDAAEVLGSFAAEKGIQAAQVFGTSAHAFCGIIAPDAEGRPGLRLADGVSGTGWADSELIVQEVAGTDLRRVVDPASGRETIARAAAAKTRVMEKPAPVPAETGPGTVPVYLFNAEFN